MPKPRRESTARADTRPAFNRPPGARALDDRPRVPKRPPNEKAKQPPTPPDKKYGGSGGKRKTSAPVKPSPARDRVKYSGSLSGSSGHVLSFDSLTKLNTYNERVAYEEKAAERKKKEKQYKNLRGAPPAAQQRRKK